MTQSTEVKFVLTSKQYGRCCFELGWLAPRLRAQVSPTWIGLAYLCKSAISTTSSFLLVSLFFFFGSILGLRYFELKGTTRAGTSVKDSVVDRESRVWGHGNLFLGGCGVIPTQTASNPTLTAIGFAIAGANAIVKEIKK